MSSSGSTPKASRPNTPSAATTPGGGGGGGGGGRSKDWPAAGSDLPTHAIPGQPLCSAREYAPGPGTYFDEHAVIGGGGGIVAAILGTVVVSKNPATVKPSTPTTPATATNGLKRKEAGAGTTDKGSAAAAAAAVVDPRPRISVVRSAGKTGGGGSAAGAVPDVNDVVLVRVLRINPRQANVAILVVGDSHSSTDEYGGIIRSQDVTETEKDKVKMQNCFKPGDIVRARVISLGDGTNYYLSTAANDLGVVFATSEASGAPMYPLDWKSMRCPVSGTVEERKCAKPTS
ncbi:hypothetical protein V1525DRAFT_399296 [Lipomyces kononenkoae]|uniref:Uncharacterized protein n=1 Tax=Lipomyces kononenkoae TaxID=34357 RepID=A0ACC3T5A4_LIPKO